MPLFSSGFIVRLHLIVTVQMGLKDYRLSGACISPPGGDQWVLHLCLSLHGDLVVTFYIHHFL